MHHGAAEPPVALWQSFHASPGEHGLAVNAPVVALSFVYTTVQQYAEERPLQRRACAIFVGGRA